MGSHATRALRLLAATVLTLLATSPAWADLATGNGSAYQNTLPQIQIVNGGTNTLKSSPGYFLGASNTAALQISPVTCYDSATSTTTGAPVIYTGTLGLLGYLFPNYPMPFVNGLTCTSATLVGTGVAIYWR